MDKLPGHPSFPLLPWRDLSPHSPRVLLINPWIHDFAAFSLWSRPVGLLACREMLSRAGCATAWLDCLDKTWSDTAWPKPSPDGRGHYPKTEIPKPDALAKVPRRFSRYGLKFAAVKDALSKLDPVPDLLLVGSGMTYWYPGAAEAMRLCREIWPQTPLVLGGIYATLCPDHAAGLGMADLILKGPIEEPGNWLALFKQLGLKAPDIPIGAGLELAQDSYPAPAFAPLLTSRGCPFSCAYCGSRLLYNRFSERDPADIIEEVHRLAAAGVSDFAFYDDALLVNFEQRLGPVLGAIVSSGLKIRLHTPNAVHAASLTPKVCALLKQAGVARVRLGLESLNFASRLDSKLGKEDFESAIENLLFAGFAPDAIGLNLLFMLPGQDLSALQSDIAYLRGKGCHVHLSDYSPVPGSPLFAEAVQASRYDLAGEPLTQNNSLWPCSPRGFSWEEKKFWHNLLTG